MDGDGEGDGEGDGDENEDENEDGDVDENEDGDVHSLRSLQRRRSIWPSGPAQVASSERRCPSSSGGGTANEAPPNIRRLPRGLRAPWLPVKRMGHHRGDC